MNRKYASSLGLLLAIAHGIPISAEAGMGLRTKFAEVTVDNLKIGQTYSLADLVNFPLRVLNTGSEPVELRVDSVAPQPEEMKPGYEAIPDPSWVRLQQSSFTVPPGLEGVTDIIVSIPDNPALLGRRFCVYLWTQSQNVGSMGVGLKGRLLLGISSQRATDEELKRRFSGKRLANLNFSLSPMEVALADVPLGRRAALQGEAAVKLLNPNSRGYTFRLTPVPVWETNIDLPQGWDAAPDAKWLEVDKPVFKAKPDSIQTLKLSLNLPAQERLKGRRLVFVLRAEILEQDIPAYAYVKVFASTQK